MGEGEETDVNEIITYTYRATQGHPVVQNEWAPLCLLNDSASGRFAHEAGYPAGSPVVLLAQEPACLLRGLLGMLYK